eukprot:7196724-Pyramimonas_sp.AAC.1
MHRTPSGLHPVVEKELGAAVADSIENVSEGGITYMSVTHGVKGVVVEAGAARRGLAHLVQMRLPLLRPRLWEEEFLHWLPPQGCPP